MFVLERGVKVRPSPFVLWHDFKPFLAYYYDNKILGLWAYMHTSALGEGSGELFEFCCLFVDGLGFRSKEIFFARPVIDININF